MTHPKQNLIDGLRELADFLTANPELTFWDGVQIDVFANTNEELAKFAKIIAPCEKRSVGAYLVLERKFAGDVKIHVNRAHDKVCTRVVVGQKTTPAEPEKIITVPAKPERVEEIVEWRCPESILRSEQVLADEPPVEDDDDGPVTPLIPPVEEYAASL